MHLLITLPDIPVSCDLGFCVVHCLPRLLYGTSVHHTGLSVKRFGGHKYIIPHFYLFDAYWEWVTEEDDSEDDREDANYLHLNECPPELVTTTEYDDEGAEITVTTLSDSDIDIGEAIFHVRNEHYQVDVVATNAEANAGQLVLDEYPEVRKLLGLGKNDPVPQGTQVWWLQLDDPDTADKNETSDLTLGFSTRHLDDDQYWDADDGAPPLRYRLVVERYPGHPGNHPGFVAYRAPKPNDGAQAHAEFVWSSTAPGISEMQMEPGTEIENLQWIFTESGTYEIWVQLVAYVREDNPHEPGEEDYDEHWTPISDNVTVTSEVKKYVVYVGDLLAEVEPPTFGVIRSVPENSPAGTDVGDPILVFSESSNLEYSLSGDGHENFAVASTTDADPYSVQISVAEGANLDYETKATYDLTLGVTNTIDHESNPDHSVDHTLAVRIELEDLGPYVTLSVDNESPAARETVHFSVSVFELPSGTIPHYDWRIRRGDSSQWHDLPPEVNPRPTTQWSTSESGGVSNTYHVRINYQDGDHLEFITTQEVRVTWGN